MNQLQTMDGIVESVRDTRTVFPNLTHREFAAWYSQRYKVTELRVLFILSQLEEVTSEMSEMETNVYELITRGAKTTKALMARTGKCRQAVGAAVRKLIDNGMVTAEGAGRSITYKAIGEGA